MSETTKLFCSCGSQMRLGVDCFVSERDSENFPIAVYCGDIFTCPVCGRQVVHINRPPMAIAGHKGFGTAVKAAESDATKLHNSMSISEKIYSWLLEQKYGEESLLHAAVCCDFVAAERLKRQLAEIIDAG